MQITRIDTTADSVSVATRKQITDNDLQQEIDYYRSKKMLESMLNKGMISSSEFKKIDELNHLYFRPNLARIMPN